MKFCFRRPWDDQKILSSYLTALILVHQECQYKTRRCHESPS